MKLSILIPVYNERALVERSLRAVLNAPLPERLERELVVVDDCSTDGTSAILERFAAREPRISLFRHSVNQGKGAAVRTAVQQATGDFCLIQDADLEYDPNDYPALMIPLLEGNADAVFGSRYLAGERRRVLPYWHTKMNQLLTWLSNMFSNLDLTDMETCYKAFRTDLLKSIPIRSNRFGIEPEITMKAAKRRLRIYEVPISYHGRTYEDGKKIGWKDGVKALGAILYFWLVDDLYTVGYGRAHLKNLTGTPAYVNWIASMVRPYLGDSVLEFDAGLGTLTGQLMGRRVRWVATESDPLYRHALANRFLRSPAVEVLPEANEGEQFDTVLLLNQLERTSDVRARLASAVSMVKPGGRIIVIAQQGPNLFGNIDRTLGHKRRLVRSELATLLQAEGLQVEEQGSFNKVMVPVWWAVSRLVGERSLSKPFLKFFDKTVWLWRRLDAVMPWAGLSCILVAKKPVSEPELETERVAIRGNLHANG